MSNALDAIRRHHTHGTTDIIILEVLTGAHFMGDGFRADEPLPILVRVRGAADIGKVHIIRHSRVVHTPPERLGDGFPIHRRWFGSRRKLSLLLRPG